MVANPDRVLIFDTTLRDGEQAPGASMNLAQKLQVARALRDLGVDVIELGIAMGCQGGSRKAFGAVLFRVPESLQLSFQIAEHRCGVLRIDSRTKDRKNLQGDS